MQVKLKENENLDAQIEAYASQNRQFLTNVKEMISVVKENRFASFETTIAVVTALNEFDSENYFLEAHNELKSSIICRERWTFRERVYELNLLVLAVREETGLPVSWVISSILALHKAWFVGKTDFSELFGANEDVLQSANIAAHSDAVTPE